MTDHDTIVIGAGPAGVTAARDLRDQGHSVLILEARERLGGRTWTRPLEGYEDVLVEMGGTYIHPASQHNLAREIRRYDQPLTPGVAELTSGAFHIRGELRTLPVPPEEIVALERAIVAMANAARRIDANVALANQHLADLDVHADDFFAPLRIPSATREFIYGVIAGVAQCDVHQVSMLQWLCWMAGLGSPISAYFAVVDEKLENGTGALWQAMVDGSEPDIEMGADVNSVVQNDSGVVVGTVSGASYRAKVCVMAVGAQVLKRIEFVPGLDSERERLLDGVYVSQGYKNFLIVENAEPGFLGFGGFGAARDPKIGWLFEDRELGEGRLLLIGWGYGERLTQNLDDAQAALAEYMPDAVVTATDGHDWAGDDYAQGITHFRRPGEGLQFASVVGKRHGDVIFAGSDVSPGVWNGWIEGGVDSGRIAAEDAGALLRAARS